MDKYLVRNAVDGSVDVNATVAAYSNALNTWVSENEFSADDIRDAIDTVFDSQIPSGDTPVRITTPTLISMAIGHMNPDAKLVPVLKEQMVAWLKGQTRFHAVKGAHGGVMRLYREGETPVAPPAPKAKKTA